MKQCLDPCVPHDLRAGPGALGVVYVPASLAGHSCKNFTSLCVCQVKLERDRGPGLPGLGGGHTHSLSLVPFEFCGCGHLNCPAVKCSSESVQSNYYRTN
ncbi:hypothetical protein BaRGS_00026415 [Batillaria attramentaria]|uniref:Uncharacterized protein n=1 Tax=Batillaria attramentaria TaxID=370345 RepID=A0ABD0K4C7_9CAEN